MGNVFTCARCGNKSDDNTVQEYRFWDDWAEGYFDQPPPELINEAVGVDIFCGDCHKITLKQIDNPDWKKLEPTWK